MKCLTTFMCWEINSYNTSWSLWHFASVLVDSKTIKTYIACAQQSKLILHLRSNWNQASQLYRQQAEQDQTSIELWVANQSANKRKLVNCIKTDVKQDLAGVTQECGVRHLIVLQADILSSFKRTSYRPSSGHLIVLQADILSSFKRTSYRPSSGHLIVLHLDISPSCKWTFTKFNLPLPASATRSCGLSQIRTQEVKIKLTVESQLMNIKILGNVKVGGKFPPSAYLCCSAAQPVAPQHRSVLLLVRWPAPALKK